MTKPKLSGTARMLRDFPGLWYLLGIENTRRDSCEITKIGWGEFRIILASKAETKALMELGNTPLKVSVMTFGIHDNLPFIEYGLESERLKRRLADGGKIEYLVEGFGRGDVLIVHRYPRQ